MREEFEDERGSIGETPATPSPSEDSVEELRDRCANEREAMSPRETSDCAGQDLADLYQNEEDGGS